MIVLDRDFVVDLHGRMQSPRQLHVHDIPIVENVALARALHATVEIDDEIPVEHYHAVAEIIGYVMGLKRGFSGWRA